MTEPYGLARERMQELLELLSSLDPAVQAIQIETLRLDLYQRARRHGASTSEALAWTDKLIAEMIANLASR